MKNDSHPARCIRILALAGTVAAMLGIPGRIVGQEGQTVAVEQKVADQGATSALMTPASAIPGALVICGGGVLPDAVIERFVELAGGPKGHIVVITTASIVAHDAEENIRQLVDVIRRFDEYFKQDKLGSRPQILHAPTKEMADDPEFGKVLKDATGVWFIGGVQGKLVDAYLGTATLAMFHDVLKRGGVIGGTSAGAAIMSPVMIRGGGVEPEVCDGFGFLPGTVVDQHFLKRKRQDRLKNVMAAHPGLVGIGIDESTALVVQGRRMTVVGNSQVWTCLSESADRPFKTQILQAGTEGIDEVADLVALSRAAIARAQPRAPTTIELSAHEPAPGTLIAVGGGAIPPEVTQEFIKAAGGAEAPILVVSTALGNEFPEADVVKWLTAGGAKNVHRIHASTPAEAQDPQVQEAVRNAQGVWFTDGRPWRLVDAFLDTPVERLFHELLQRGGVIGGNAAGATILGSYLVRGNPLKNSDMIAEGYDRGFGLLPGMAIDQRFSQQKRYSDMSALKKALPALTGLGVDESTALIVRGQNMQVVGKHQVAVYDRTEEETVEDEQDYQVLRAGDQYDFKERRRVTPEAVVAQAAESEPEEEADPDDAAAVSAGAVREFSCH